MPVGNKEIVGVKCIYFNCCTLKITSKASVEKSRKMHIHRELLWSFQFWIVLPSLQGVARVCRVAHKHGDRNNPCPSQNQTHNVYWVIKFWRSQDPRYTKPEYQTHRDCLWGCLLFQVTSMSKSGVGEKGQWWFHGGKVIAFSSHCDDTMSFWFLVEKTCRKNVMQNKHKRMALAWIMYIKAIREGKGRWAKCGILIPHKVFLSWEP